MAFRVVRFEYDRECHWGVVHNDKVARLDGDWPTTRDFVLGLQHSELAAAVQRISAKSESADHVLALAQVKVLSPVTVNQQFICQGANYRSHMLESGLDPDAKSFNMIFRKASSSIVSATSDVVRPSNVQLLDYEVELGLVLGKDITSPRQVSSADLPELIAGLVVVNDYSARDIQIPEMQFYKGKSFRTFGPVGPYLCIMEPQDFHLFGALRLQLSVNGELRQSARADDMVFAPPATLTELSALQTLCAGDLIATGTPAGCAMRVPPIAVQRVSALLPDSLRFKLFIAGQTRRRAYLQPGDVVEASIRTEDGALDLGLQRNRIVKEPS